jgi:hypothetical protein
VWLFVRRIVPVVATGVVVGLAGALAVGRILRAVLLDAGSTDGVVFAATTTLLVAVVLGASVVPAFGASRTDPVSTLRHD